jgi:hypothetical protein
VKLEGSNNGVDWVSQETLFNQVALTAGSINTATASSTAKLAAFVRFAVTMTGTNPVALVQLTACGHDRTG